MKVVDFKACNYFSPMATTMAVVLIPAALLTLSASIVAGVIILAVCIIILTTHYRLKIDFENREFYDYVFFLGFKSGEKGYFDTIQYLFINAKHVSQTVNSRVSSMTVRKVVYDGYLKFSDKEKIHIATKDSKSALIKKLRTISNQLHIKIIDYTEGDPRVV